MVFMRIAIVKLSALGDIVHAMVVLQYIKKYNHDILIDWFVDETFKGLLQYNPDINKVYAINFKKAKKKKSITILFNEFRKIRGLEPYEIVIDMQGLVKSAIIARIIPSKVTLGFNMASSRESLASILYNQRFNIAYSENIIARNFELAKFGIKFSYNIEELNNKKIFLYSNALLVSSVLSETKKNIIIVPGASHSSKCYSPEKLANITQEIDANFIITWGNNQEKVLANKIQKLSSSIKICDKLSLDGLVSLFSQVDLVIGSDTGPTHIAWALNIPSIILFGPTPGYRNTFPNNKNIIESNSKVNPNKINKNDYSINDINANDIIKMANELLKTKK
jgi:heptosyltransferase I